MEDTNDDIEETHRADEMEQNYRINVIIESLDTSDEETEVEHPQRDQSERSSITPKGLEGLFLHFFFLSLLILNFNIFPLVMETRTFTEIRRLLMVSHV